MTQEQFDALKTKLEKLKKTVRPQAIRDTQLYGENGDFSENAEYQIAKGRLRGINRTIDELEKRIGQATIIDTPQDTTSVQIGHSVVISANNIEQTFTILGSTESNPSAGVISYLSPLGAALIGRAIGDTISLEVGERVISYTIIRIE